MRNPFKIMNENDNKLKEYNVSKRDFALTIICSILLSVLMFSGVIAIIINYILLYVDSRIPLAFLLALIFSLIGFLSELFIYKALSKGQMKNIFLNCLFTGFILLFFGIIVVVILIIMGVI